MSKVKAETSNKLVQTAIHCFPHILLTEDDLVKVTCDRACQTAATITPNTANSNSYALLEFIPYQVIAEGSLKELDLPRRALLQWKLPALNEYEEARSVSIEAGRTPEREESELYRQRGVLKNANSNDTSISSFSRLLGHHHYIMQKSVSDQEAQTVLTVLPHVLETDEVANVYTELSIQTSITCSPNASISNILPQLKGNLSHTSASAESFRREYDTSQAEASFSPPNELNEGYVSVSTTQATSQSGCQCRSQLINKIAKKMRVQASTLKLTPKVFPASVKFEDRMMEVLNTTIAILQNEMAKLMEVYLEDEMVPCKAAPCDLKDDTEQSEEQNAVPEIQNASSPPEENEDARADIEENNPEFTPSASLEEAINEHSASALPEENENAPSAPPLDGIENEVTASEESENEYPPNEDANTEPNEQEQISTDIQNGPKSCKCGAQMNNGFVAPADQTEITKTTATRETIDPNTKQPIKENIIEEITRRVFVNGNNETVVEERIIKTTFVETQPVASISKTEPSPCLCAPSETESAPLLDEITPPAELSEMVEDETEDDALTEDLASITESIVETATYQTAASELAGDNANNKNSIFIPCECEPSAAGAAPPTLSEDVSPPTLSANEAAPTLSEDEAPPTLSEDEPPPTLSEDEPSPALSEDEPPPTLSEDEPAPTLSVIEASPPEPQTEETDKSIKFEFLMKKNIKDVESVSAASAIVVRATISSPDTSKRGKDNAQTRSSLPDLREQVIRLSVIYKNGTTEPETRIEELLTPGRPIHITPNKSPCSRVDKKPLNAPPAVSCPNKPNTPPYITNGTVCECGRLACERRSPLTLAGPSFAISKKDNSSNICCCFDKHVQEKPNQLSSSKMWGSSRPTQPSSCDPSCGPSSPAQLAPPLPPPKTECLCSPSQPPISPPPPPPSLSSRPPSILVNSEIPGDQDLEITIAVSFGEDSDDTKTKTLSLTYEDDASYEEPYMETLTDEDDLTTTVQTDLTLGDKLESESLSSILKDEDFCDLDCSSRTEMPWGKISLPPPGSYSIKPKETQPEVKAEERDADEGEGEGGGAEVIEGGGAAEPGEGSGAEAGEVAKGTPTEGGGENDLLNTALAGEETEPPPPAEPEPRKQKQKLIFEDEISKHNEPYMEGLYRTFPNSDDEDGDCGSHTEMPWKDIVLPENCRIRKMKKTKKCTCASKSQQLTGMFLPSRIPPKNVRDDEDSSVIELHLGFEEPMSGMISVDQGVTEVRRAVSACSTISSMHRMAKRSPKEFTLRVELEQGSNYSVSFRAGQGNPRGEPESSTSEVLSTCSQPFNVTTKQETEGKTSSVIITIKPSTDCPYESATLRIAEDKQSAELNVTNPSTFTGASPAETRSCTTTSTMSNKGTVKNSSSMPEIPSQRSIKATISVKKMGESSKTPGECCCMTPKIPEEPINVNLNICSPDTQAKEADVPEVFSPGKCPCKDSVKTDTFKEDPVMVALEAYEAEMKPLRQALTALQQKIRNLNMPEMKGCMCTTALQGDQQESQLNSMFPTAMQSTVQGTADSSATGTTMRFRPQPPGTCRYYQPPGFHRPVPQAPPYGYLPPPMLPPYRQPHTAAPPNYMPPPIVQERPCCCGGQARNSQYGSQYSSARSSGHRRQDGHRPSRSRGAGGPYSREDICMQARMYGMYPDYRGRAYPDQQMAYQDSYSESLNRGRHHQKCKIRRVISLHSSGDLSDFDSQGGSDLEEQFYVEPRQKRGCNGCKEADQRRSGNRRAHSSKSSSSRTSNFDNYMPCRDSQHLRPGQAVKTGPDDFLSCSSMLNKQSRGTETVPKVISRNKIHVKVPYR